MGHLHSYQLRTQKPSFSTNSSISISPKVMAHTSLRRFHWIRSTADRTLSETNGPMLRRPITTFSYPKQYSQCLQGCCITKWAKCIDFLTIMTVLRYHGDSHRAWTYAWIASLVADCFVMVSIGAIIDLPVDHANGTFFPIGMKMWRWTCITKIDFTFDLTSHMWVLQLPRLKNMALS